MRAVKRIIRAVAVSALVLCAANVYAADKSLYDRLGGKPAVVDDFVANVAADTRINGFFANTDIPRLKRLLVEQICAGSGGPCTYTGRDMKTTHMGMGVQDPHFAALVEDLVKSLDKLKVPAREKNELLGVLGPMKTDIVMR
ncbi:MAG TPA: group 1 truncated hemoglobin [Burkholderiales bacterium]|nr:group 1 truncated hemoglobin [Burkholderiales bacterium]